MSNYAKNYVILFLPLLYIVSYRFILYHRHMSKRNTKAQKNIKIMVFLFKKMCKFY
nr:MAG TPA: hypothetical protein [Caudoviricetes sp.]